MLEEEVVAGNIQKVVMRAAVHISMIKAVFDALLETKRICELFFSLPTSDSSDNNDIPYRDWKKRPSRHDKKSSNKSFVEFVKCP